MSGPVTVCVAWFAVVLVIGAVVVLQAPRMSAGLRASSASRRIASAIDVEVGEIGRLATAVVIVLAGWAAILIVGWYIGEVAHVLENAVDKPLFRWFQERQVGGTWSSTWRQLTKIGSPHYTAYVAGVATIMFAVLWRLRGHRFWIPGACIWLGYVLVRYGQFILKDVVDRGHPPTSLGSYPSGGCARVITVYGLVIFFTVLCIPTRGPRAWALGGLLTAILVSVQAYARIYNLEHWVTDVVGGIIFGTLVVTLVMGAYFVVESRADPGRRRPPAHQSDRVRI